MLTLALMLLAAPEKVRHKPVVQTSPTVRAVVADATRADCTLNPMAVGCPDRNYRLDPTVNVAAPTPSAIPDEKWRRCGLLGMPVCPGKGTELVKVQDEPTPALD